MTQESAERFVCIEHEMIQAGYVRENDVIKSLGCSWFSWVNDYRDEIPAKITPTERWYHRDGLVDWWSTRVDCGCSD